MYLTMIEYEGRSWMVDLRVIPHERRPGDLVFSFVHAPEGDGEIRYTWQVPPELADTLHLDGRLSEAMLRAQLARAMAEERAADASAPAGTTARAGRPRAHAELDRPPARTCAAAVMEWTAGDRPSDTQGAGYPCPRRRRARSEGSR